MARLHNTLVCLLALTALLCSCIGRREFVLEPVEQEAAIEPAEADTAPAEKWILSRVSERLKEVLGERVVHIKADGAAHVYRETWGKETPHVDVFFSDYALRIPLQEIAGYPWDSVVEQFETGQLGPVLLKNGWQVWLGYIERKDAISHDLGLSVRDACSRLSSSGDANRDRVVQRLCDDFRKGFVFADDVELFRRLWHSPFAVENPTQLNVNEALATLFLADLKRLIAPPTAGEHVAEVWTPSMRGFEFGDGTSEHGFSAELFDQRNHVTVLFLPPAMPGEPLDEVFRQKVLASVRRHGLWAPGLEMVRQSESVLQPQDPDDGKEIATLLLFSALQFPDHKARAASMLVKLFPPGAPERDDIIAIVNAIIRGE